MGFPDARSAPSEWTAKFQKCATSTTLCICPLYVQDINNENKNLPRNYVFILYKTPLPQWNRNIVPSTNTFFYNFLYKLSCCLALLWSLNFYKCISQVFFIVQIIYP